MAEWIDPRTGEPAVPEQVNPRTVTSSSGFNFYMQSDLAAEEKEMEKAIAAAGTGGKTHQVYAEDADDKPIEGTVGKGDGLTGVLKEMMRQAKSPKDFQFGRFSLMNPEGADLGDGRGMVPVAETIVGFGKSVLTCRGCGLRTRVVWVKTHKSWVYECSFRCKKLYWIPNDVALETEIRNLALTGPARRKGRG